MTIRNVCGRAGAQVALLAVPGACAFVVLFGCARSTGTPETVARTTDCMFKVLQATPGVSDPRCIYLAIDGQVKPHCMYHSSKGTQWQRSSDFRPAMHDTNSGKLHMLIQYIGRPPIVHPGEIDVDRVVADKWRKRCDVAVSVEID